MPSEKTFSDRMSDSDALMWNLEKDPTLRSTITAISLLDGPPDRRRLIEKSERASRTIARLRQRPVSSSVGVAPPIWVTDPNFDLSYHLRFVGASGDRDLRSLLDQAAPMTMQGFDRARPLWEMTVVEGLQDGKAALVQKIHHALTDGVGGIEIALMLLDTERAPADPGPMPEAPAPDEPTMARLVTEGFGHERRRVLGITQRATSAIPGLAAHPNRALGAAATMASSIGRLLAPSFSPLSPIMGNRSMSVHFDVVSASLPQLKAAARRSGGRLNDAFLAAVAGGFARYHAAAGEACDAVRVSMPINLRQADGDTLGGNQIAPARFPLPLGIDDPVERMAAIRALVAVQRDEPALQLADAIAGILNRLPIRATTSLFGGMLKGVDCVVSNVPGLPFQTFLCGAKLQAQYAMGPLAGAAVNLTLLSHLDDVHIGVVTDPAAVTDPDLLVDCLSEGLDEVSKLA